MPKARQHFMINLAVLSAVEVYRQRKEIEANPDQQFDVGQFIVNVGAGTFAGALPDIVEPSLGNPNHRGFCHSLAAAVLVWWAVSGRHTTQFSTQAKALLLSLGVGYSAHLAADLFLSKGKGMGLVSANF